MKNYTKVESGLFKCNVCGAEIKPLGFAGHFRMVHQGFRMHTDEVWNKGSTKENDVRILKYSESISTKTKGRKGRLHSPESKAHLSKKAKERGFGGNTSKQKLYFEKQNGDVVYLQSSYEIRFASLLEEFGVEWERPKPFEWIDDDGIDHKYYPDFRIGDVYIDTKNNYLIKRDARKIELVIEQNDIDLRVIGLESINKLYVEETFKRPIS